EAPGECGAFGKIRLVYHQPRGQCVRLRNHEEPVDHPLVRLRFRRREYHHHLVHVRHDHPLAPAATWLAPGELRAPRKYAADRPVMTARAGLQHYTVAHRELTRTVERLGRLVASVLLQLPVVAAAFLVDFQASAESDLQLLAGIREHSPGAAGTLEHRRGGHVLHAAIAAIAIWCRWLLQLCFRNGSPLVRHRRPPPASRPTIGARGPDRRLGARARALPGGPAPTRARGT